MNNKPENSNIQDLLPKIDGAYRFNVPLSKTNWFNVGGEAQVLFRPSNIEQLVFFLKNRPQNINITILGVGSNLLVRDGGIKGVVIKLGREFTQMTANGNIIESGAAALCYNLAMFAAVHNLTGLEFLVGIPGSVGGASFMNAGAYGSDISSSLISADIIDENGNIQTLSNSDIGYIYRGQTLPENIIFIKSRFKLEQGNRKDIEEKMDNISKAREETQPIRSKTSGSTFKNPEGKKAWQLIDEAGCRGLKIGGAEVSTKHCNFFINSDNATATDIENLGEEVRKRVKEESGIELEWEIKIIGDKI